MPAAEKAGAKILTIRQPWAWAILHAGKNIENRSWYTHHRGPLLIASAASISLADYERSARELAQHYRIKIPPRGQLTCAAILGMVDLVDCVEEHRSRWFTGDCYGFVLRNPVPFPKPIPWKGRLGLTPPTPAVRRRLTQLGIKLP